MAQGCQNTHELHEDKLKGDFLVTTSQLKDEQGHPKGSVHVARDITERKRAERLLAESEARYRALIEMSPDGILVVRDDCVLFANPSARQLFGTATDGELLGRNLFDLQGEQDRARSRSGIASRGRVKRNRR